MVPGPSSRKPFESRTAPPKANLCAAKCSATLPVTIIPLDQIPHQQGFALLVNHPRGFNLTVFVPPGDFVYDLDGQCVDSDGNTTQSQTMP